MEKTYDFYKVLFFLHVEKIYYGLKGSFIYLHIGVFVAHPKGIVVQEWVRVHQSED